MRIPVVSPVWNVVSSAAWDVALDSVELMTLGTRAWWWRLRLAASRRYLLDPPARVVLREAPALDLPEGHAVYGETPALSLFVILRRLQAGPDDVLFDLGCGRGLTVLAAAMGYGMEAVGIDAIPTLMRRAERMRQDLGVANARFVEGDFLQADLSRGTVFYIASTTFRTEVMRALVERIAASVDRSRPIRAATLSQPLGPPFEVLGKARFPMTWGWNTVFFQHLQPPTSSSLKSSSSA